MSKFKDFFKPEDFIYVTGFQGDKAMHAASIANEKLNKLIESWPVVYGSKFISNDGSAFDVGSVWNITKLSDKTHTARLAFIEEIKKEQCVHTPYRLAQVKEEWRCGTCGAELQATWTEVKKS